MARKLVAGLALTLFTLAWPVGPGRAQEELPSIFSDVERTHWAYQALEKLVMKYNLKLGYPDGTFKGERPITRYEMAALLAQVLEQMPAGKTSSEDIAQLKKLIDEFRGELEPFQQEIQDRLQTLEDQADLLDMDLEKQSSALEHLRAQLPFRLSGGIGLRYELVTPDFADLSLAQENWFQASVKLALDGKATDMLSYGARLIVGSPQNIGSTWWKLGDFWAKVPFHLDRFFLRFEPVPQFGLTLGKFPNPFANSELLFDGDIHPTGAVQHLSFKHLSPWLHDLFLTAGESIVSMDSEFGHVFLLSGKAGVDLRPADFLDIELRGGFHHYIGADKILNANATAISRGLPVRLVGMSSKNTPGASFSIANGFAGVTLNLIENFPLSLEGDYLLNVAMPAKNQGLELAATFGQNKEPGDFFFGYRFKYLEADANISFFVEDILKGTDVAAHEGVFGVRLMPQTSFVVNFEAASPVSEVKEMHYTLRTMLLQNF